MTTKQVTKQFMLTPAVGKKLIAKSIVYNSKIKEAVVENTIVIIAGTTNGYIAEEILSEIEQGEDFSRQNFYRGITTLPEYAAQQPEEFTQEEFPGDVVIESGEWKEGKTIFDVVDDLEQGDIVLKGANALDLENKQAGVYIGSPSGGTIHTALQAVIGRRVKLYMPVGLEKRVASRLNQIARKLNSATTAGPRLLPVSGEVITEIDAIETMTDTEVELVAAGGVEGAEGSCWLAVSGSEEEVDKVGGIIKDAYLG